MLRLLGAIIDLIETNFWHFKAALKTIYTGYKHVAEFSPSSGWGVVDVWRRS